MYIYTYIYIYVYMCVCVYGGDIYGGYTCMYRYVCIYIYIYEQLYIYMKNKSNEIKAAVLEAHVE